MEVTDVFCEGLLCHHLEAFTLGAVLQVGIKFNHKQVKLDRGCKFEEK